MRKDRSPQQRQGVRGDMPLRLAVRHDRPSRPQSRHNHHPGAPATSTALSSSTAPRYNPPQPSTRRRMRQPVLFSLSLVFAAATHASPLTQQIPFQHPALTATTPTSAAASAKWADRLPCLDVALQSLRDASAQVLDTFESVMSEFRDAANDLTWTLPRKNIVPRPDHDWDFSVSSSALPEHSLRVKKPNGLGVDDVKQVCPGLFLALLTCSTLAI